MPKRAAKGYLDDFKWRTRRAQSDKLKAARLGLDRRSAAERAAVEQAELGLAGSITGMVAETQKYRCFVLVGDDVIQCDLNEAKMSMDAEPLVVGDLVTLDLKEDRGILMQVLPRASKLVRMRADSNRSSLGRDAHVLAANIDVAVIVAAAASPPFRPRLIDRYLVLCQYGNVAPLVCINKCDLVDERPDLSLYERMDIPVLYVSVVTGEGLEELRASLRGKSAILTGHSGVGKSSIVNALVGSDVQEVAEVGGGVGRGRHTTTSSTLRKLEGDIYLIDTPGIRTLGLWEIDKDTLPLYFPQFDEFAENCKFRDCGHIHEPGCGVKAAVELGNIPAGWYDSYLRMANE